MVMRDFKSLLVVVALALGIGVFLNFTTQTEQADSLPTSIVEDPPILPALDSNNIVVLYQKVFEQLQRDYIVAETEKLFCIIGEKVGNEIIIRDMKEEGTMLASGTNTMSKSEFACQMSGTLGTLHFHLQDYGQMELLCEPSLVDVYTFGTLSVMGEGHIIQAIQCGDNKLSFFDTSVGGTAPFEVKSFEWIVVENT